MTCRRDDLNPLDALYQIARKYPGGIEALAPRIDMSASLLYKKVEGVRPISFDEWCQVLAMCAAANVPDAHQALHALNWRFGHVAVKLPDIDEKTSSELAEAVMRVFKEGGDVARAVEKALEKDGIDSGEFAEIDREVEQAISALAGLREKARAAVSQPKRLRAVKP